MNTYVSSCYKMSGYAMTQLAGRCPVKWGTSRLFVYIHKTKIYKSEGAHFVELTFVVSLILVIDQLNAQILVL